MGFAAALAMTSQKSDEAARRHGSRKCSHGGTLWWWEPQTAEVHLETCGRTTDKQPETARALQQRVQVADESRVTAVQSTTVCGCRPFYGARRWDGGEGEGTRGTPDLALNSRPREPLEPQSNPSGSSHLQVMDSCHATTTGNCRSSGQESIGVDDISPVEEPTLQRPDTWKPSI